MRGKEAQSVALLKFYRITPAYAGKRGRVAASSDARRDHPRLCGEKLDRIRLYKPDSGSPPPMRGKAETGEVTTVGYRITPAYAGKRTIISCVIAPR